MDELDILIRDVRKADVLSPNPEQAIRHLLESWLSSKLAERYETEDALREQLKRYKPARAYPSHRRWGRGVRGL